MKPAECGWASESAAQWSNLVTAAKKMVKSNKDLFSRMPVYADAGLDSDFYSKIESKSVLRHNDSEASKV